LFPHNFYVFTEFGTGSAGDKGINSAYFGWVLAAVEN